MIKINYDKDGVPVSVEVSEKIVQIIKLQETINMLELKVTKPVQAKLCPVGKCSFGSDGQCIECGQHRPAPSR